MRLLALFTAACTLFYTAHATAEADPIPQPYLNALPNQAAGPLQLLKRQSCPSGYSACSALGASGTCCPSGTVCARDQNGNVACCPNNAVCTGAISGTASRSTGTSSTTPFVLGGSTTQTSAPTITASATLAAGYSTLSNALFPFLVIPTTYANSQQCLNAYSSCQSASTACFNSLAGQVGVTISGVGSLGVTQAAVTGTVAQSAASICSSLSAQGCYNIQSTICSGFGSGTGSGISTVTTGFVQANLGPAAKARCTGAMYTAAAAVAVAGAGVAGMAMA